jgi:hypothetical protein
MLTDSIFWFSPPTTFLTSMDRVFGFVFAGFLIVAIIIMVVRKFSRNEINNKLLTKFFHLFLNLGIIGILWFGFRYENTPVLGLRYWAALIIIVGLIWLGFILKYLIFNFSKEQKEYQHQLVKNKYIPGSKR